MSGYLHPTNYIEDPEEVIRQAKAKLRKKKPPTTLSEEDQPRRSLTPVFEAMANKTLREFSTPTTANIRTGPAVHVVQANQFCGKAHEDASVHLQHFLEICSTFTIKGVERDAILIHLFPFSLLGRAKQWFYANREKNTT
jgi:hypothetical protein